MTNPLATIPAVYIDVYQAKQNRVGRARPQRWRWRASAAGNNHIIGMSSEAYTNREDALQAVYLLFGPATDIYLRDPSTPTTKIRTGNQ